MESRGDDRLQDDDVGLEGLGEIRLKQAMYEIRQVMLYYLKPKLYCVVLGYWLGCGNLVNLF